METFPKILSEDNFSLELSMPLILRIGFLTVDEPPFLDSLITLGNLEEESGFECSYPATLRTMPGFARTESPRSWLLSPFGILPGPCRLDLMGERLENVF